MEYSKQPASASAAGDSQWSEAITGNDIMMRTVIFKFGNAREVSRGHFYPCLRKK